VKEEMMMSYLARVAICAATFSSMLLMAPQGGQALPIGAKSLRANQAIVQVKRECIAWERTADGRSKCVRWAECGPTVC
jgi:hypothetical protein